jgi:hypothetical protein
MALAVVKRLVAEGATPSILARRQVQPDATTAVIGGDNRAM